MSNDIKINVDYVGNKPKPEISVTHENYHVEIKIKIDIRKKSVANTKTHENVPDTEHCDNETPQEMVKRYKLHNDLSSVLKPCW
jgi:hypothetical protein